jgi:hypothetical protein
MFRQANEYTDLMANEDSIRNPYNPQAPTTNPGMFFGREDVFAFIRQRLITGRRAQAMGIIGQRGMGKTSVLLQVIHQVEARYVTAYIDLADVRFDEVGGLLAAMADAARQAMDDAGLSTYRLPPIPDDPNVDLWTWFSKTYLDVTLSALRNNRRLLFLFDETSRLLDAIDRRDIPDDFGDTLGQLIANDDRMDIIFALDAEDEHRLETFSPLSDPLLHKRLSLMEDEAAEELIRRPSSPYYAVQDEAVEGILAMTGGHPYLMHVMCGLLWERAMGRPQPSPITLDDVSGVLRQATDEADPVLRLTWSRSTPNERQALSALTSLTISNRGAPVRTEDTRQWLLRESEHPLDETSLAAALRRLEYREVLRAPTKGSYIFTSGLQHQWLILNGDVQPTQSLLPSRRAARRLAIPVALMLILAVGAALLLAKVTNRPAGVGQVTPTVTLDSNIQATRNMLNATQTAFVLLNQAATSTVSATNTINPTSTSNATQTPLVHLNLSATLDITAITPIPLVTVAKVTAAKSTSPTPATPTSTVRPTDTITPSTTFTWTPTNTATDTLTPTNTDTPTETNTPQPPTVTYTPSSAVTAPPFPTGQVRATSTLGP